MNVDLTAAAGASALDGLAIRFGITLDFVDAHGRPVRTSLETRTHLLASMGVDAATEQEAQAALADLEAADAALVLPPTLVVRPEHGVCIIAVNAAGNGALEWRVRLEDGSVREGTADAVQRVLAIDALPFGYHRLELPRLGASAALIATPGACWLPDAASSGLWGIAVQLYLLRSERNWGIGDFSDLARFVELAGARGCAVVGLNPLHQMFLDEPEQASPYSPATRLFLNPLYIDVTAVPEFIASAEAQALVRSEPFQSALAAARNAPLVDYTAVTTLKLDALRAAFSAFDDARDARRSAFEQFCADKGESLTRASLFQVLRQHFAAERTDRRHWHSWPIELQDPSSDACRRFADAHREQIAFQNWLQFLADEQLQGASDAACRAGMRIGLYRDLAVGCDSAGAETWASPEAFLQRTTVGAPPDIFNPAGQNWGLPPFDPAALRRDAYGSFVELIRANMRHAGGLRIDHVMGLLRLYCIPDEATPADGAYVAYPLDDLIGVLALESQRQQCLVVGEDLGTVPPGFREKLAAANILSYRVLFFEQDFNTGIYARPQDYPGLALAVTSSHDLPTLLAWWEGRDIEIKERLKLYPTSDEVEAQHARRRRDRHTLLEAFRDAGLLAEMPRPDDVSAAEFTEMAHAFLALTPAALVATQLDDLTGETEPVNVPGTSTENPNWRRKYRLSLEELASTDGAWVLTEPLARTAAPKPAVARARNAPSGPRVADIGA